jgi:hypothetical protein
MKSGIKETSLLLEKVEIEEHFAGITLESEDYCHCIKEIGVASVQLF